MTSLYASYQLIEYWISGFDFVEPSIRPIELCQIKSTYRHDLIVEVPLDRFGLPRSKPPAPT
jgi:hypothetical protein